MKRNLLLSSLAALACGTLFSLSASAQTCASPAAWQPDASGAPTVSATTCGGDTTATLYCGGNFDAKGPAYVIRSNFGSTRTFSAITGSGTPLAVYVVPVANGCASGGACQTTGDTVSAAIPTGQIPDGNYYIIVTAASSSASGTCGDFVLTSDGTFPVSLKSFSIN